MSSPHSHRPGNVKVDSPIIENEEEVETEQQDDPELEESEQKSPVAARSSNSTTALRGFTDLGTQRFPLLQQYQLEGNLLGGGQQQQQPQQQYPLMTTTSIMMPQQQQPLPRQTLVLQYSPSLTNVATATRQGVVTLQQQPVLQLQQQPQPQYILIVGNHPQQPQLSAAPPTLLSVGPAATATGGMLPGNVKWQLALPPNGTSQFLGAQQQLPTLVADNTSAFLSSTTANNVATYSSNGAWLPMQRPPFLQPPSLAPQMTLQQQQHQQQQQQWNHQMLAVLQNQSQGMAVPGYLMPQRPGSFGTVVVPTSTSSKRRPEDILSSSTMQPRTTLHETSSNTALAAAAASSSPPRLPDEKPKRPLSAYNIFFKEERARMLEQLHNEPDDDNNNINNIIIYEADGKKQRARKKRKRKSISFEDLARQIGKKWQAVTAETKARYQRKADQDKRRYTREKALYLEAKRAEQNGALAAVKEEEENDDEVK